MRACVARQSVACVGCARGVSGGGLCCACVRRVCVGPTGGWCFGWTGVGDRVTEARPCAAACPPAYSPALLVSAPRMQRQQREAEAEGQQTRGASGARRKSSRGESSDPAPRPSVGRPVGPSQKRPLSLCASASRLTLRTGCLPGWRGRRRHAQLKSSQSMRALSSCGAGRQTGRDWPSAAAPAPPPPWLRALGETHA